MPSIYLFADIIDKELKIIRYPNQDNRFLCEFSKGEVAEKGSLSPCQGEGNSMDAAIASYVQNIKGKSLVFNATGDKRAEYRVPNNLTA